MRLLRRFAPRNDVELKKAKHFFIGGVNSPVRSFRSVGGNPLFFERGRGAYLYDVDGNRYIDFCQSWGALILGHAHPEVVRAIQKRAKTGTSFGAPTPYETELAEHIRRYFPSCEKLRFTSSGTEAVMTAVRLARGFTNRTAIIKFEGGYHGHSDALLVKAGSGLATLGIPDSAGVPAGAARDTFVLPYNDTRALERAFRSFKNIAAVIIEPLAGNMGFIPAEKTFLQKLRRLTKANGSLLIFDEVITGFRVALGGAQSLYGIRPDVTTLGKVIGGGLPVGCVGGPAAIMSKLAPEGPVYQAGTLSGNPISMAAGTATLKALGRKGIFKSLEKHTGHFTSRLETAFRRLGIPAHVPARGSAFSIFFQPKPPKTFHDISQAHVAFYKTFFHHMLDRGFYFPPSPYEAMFLSTAHTEKDLGRTLDAARSIQYNKHPQRI